MNKPVSLGNINVKHIHFKQYTIITLNKKYHVIQAQIHFQIKCIGITK